MGQSESIKELAGALAKAQGAMRPAEKNSVNPHFKNRYADLASILDACRSALAANGLAILQCPRAGELETILAHASGEWVSAITPILADKPGPQPYGSGLTYARRYALSSMLGIAADDDDDAEAATSNGRHAEARARADESARAHAAPPAAPAPAPKPADAEKDRQRAEYMRIRKACAAQPAAALDECWKAAKGYSDGAITADVLAIFEAACLAAGRGVPIQAIDGIIATMQASDQQTAQDVVAKLTAEQPAKRSEHAK